MAIRMTGLISGMDTESIVKQLMDAHKLKNKKTTDKKELLTWKQEKWKDLNAKLYKLYQEDISKMRLQSSYMTKKVTSSNEDLVTVTGNTNAPEGSHSLTIDQLASSQYVTGGVLGSSVTTSTKLKDLGMTSTSGNNSVITITNGDKSRELIVTDNTTLGDFLNACKETGLNASYDTAQKRIFISSKASGLDNKFSITTGEISSHASISLNTIKNYVNYSGLTAAEQGKVYDAIQLLEGKSAAEIDGLYTKAENGTKSTDPAEQKAIDAVTTLRDLVIKKAEKDVKASATKEVKDEIINTLISSYGDPDEATLTALETEIQAEIAAKKLPADTDVTATAKERYKKNQAVLDDIKAQVASKIDDGKLTVPEDKTREEYINETAQTSYDKLTQADKTKLFDNMVAKKLGTEESQTKIQDTYDSNIESYKNGLLTDSEGLVAQMKIYAQNSAIINDSSANNLSKLKLGEIDGSAVTAATTNDMTVVEAMDSKITLDGAELTASTNIITANGLTITLKGKTQGETISLSVNNNTQGIYDMVKNFVKNYNAILKEMNTLYNAASTRGYDPLSDDERESMTDDQIEKWETKIKDSILRRDSTLGTVRDAMRSSLQTSVEVDGKKYSLASYGIQTSTIYTENGLLHIFGDKEDATYSDREDKLMKAIEEDPDTVMQVLSGISKNLYDTMAEKMSAIPNLRSALTFYNDKEMDKLQTQYKERMSKDEKKLKALEDKYYKQFSAMETAMAKLQKQQSALSGLLGNTN